MFAKSSPLVRCLAAFFVCSVSFSGLALTFEEIKEMAEQGEPKAQALLGSQYYYGEAVPQDYKQAFKWYTKAAE